MGNKVVENITILGTGNIATHLALAFHRSGLTINQIYGRNGKSAANLARLVSARHVNALSKINKNSDIYFLSVADNALEEILETGMLSDLFLIHNAGSVPIDILKPYSADYGVFYPLQSFIKDKEIDFTNIPVCVEANNPQNLLTLKNLARSLTAQVYETDSDKRLAIHIAAVFACNFSNYFYTVAEKILEDNHIDFDILKPLIRETSSRVMQTSPGKVQTGPARRNDLEVINRHLEVLEKYPELRDLYKKISENIAKSYS